MSVLLAATCALLFGTGTYLAMQRRLTRVILGVGLLGHGANLLIVLTAGGSGSPAFVGEGDPRDFLDPLPQAFALTAIVITFGVTAFLLALAYRSWQLTHDDMLEDDIEDRRVARSDEADEEVGDEEAAAMVRHHLEDEATGEQP